VPDSRTLLVALAHPDDEIGAAGSILAQRALGDRVVILWLTRGEMTEALGEVSAADVARLRMEQGRAAAELLGAEPRFLDFPDAALEATPEAARRVASVIADVQPDGVLTWGDAWIRGMRHPDHQACARIVRDAITLARIKKVVEPAIPHRAATPLFTYRGFHSCLPAVVVDVEPYVESVMELGRFYRDRVGFGHPEWLEARLAEVGGRWGLRYGEEFDAWETAPGVVGALLPAEHAGPARPPDRVS
jgi:LmbE family N-acetylglucosaminyl deacetylase